MKVSCLVGALFSVLAVVGYLSWRFSTNGFMKDWVADMEARGERSAFVRNLPVVSLPCALVLLSMLAVIADLLPLSAGVLAVGLAMIGAVVAGMRPPALLLRPDATRRTSSRDHTRFDVVVALMILALAVPMLLIGIVLAL